MCHYRATNMICNHSQNAVNDRCELIVFWFHYIKTVIYIDDLRQRNSLQLQCTQFRLLLFRKNTQFSQYNTEGILRRRSRGQVSLTQVISTNHLGGARTLVQDIYIWATHLFKQYPSLPIPNQQMSHKIYHQQYTRRIYFQFHTWTKKRWKPLNYAYTWT